MNQFVQRVVNYVANEVIIKGLANSRTFQSFAVRTNKQYEDFAKQGTEQLNKALEEMAQLVVIEGRFRVVLLPDSSNFGRLLLVEKTAWWLICGTKTCSSPI